MSIKDRIRNRLRRWLLTDEERQIVNRVERCESDVESVESEWSELMRALNDAEIVGEHTIDSADVLVLTGSSHTVTQAGFSGPIYINGNHHVIDNCRFETDED